MKIKIGIMPLLSCISIVSIMAMEKSKDGQKNLNDLMLYGDPASLKLAVAWNIVDNQFYIAKNKVPYEILEYLNCIESIYSWKKISIEHKKLLIALIENPNLDISSYFLFGNKSKYQVLNEILINAISKGLNIIVKLLLKLGCDPDAKSDEGVTGLIIAVRNSNKEIVQTLLEFRANINARSAWQRTTALIQAIFKGDKDMVQILLDNGADVNCQDDFGNRALVYAVCTKRKDIVELLLNANAQIDIVISRGKHTIMAEAAYRGDIKIVKILFRAGAISKQALFFAAQYNKIKIIKFLIEQGVDANIQNMNGHTPLMLVIENRTITGNRKKKTVKVLLNLGADPNIKNNDGETALSLAKNALKKYKKNSLISGDYKEIVKILKEYNNFNKKCFLM